MMMGVLQVILSSHTRTVVLSENTDQLNSMECSNVNPHICSCLNFTKIPEMQWFKEPPQPAMLGTLDTHMKNKWVNDLNVNSKTLKLLGKRKVF